MAPTAVPQSAATKAVAQASLALTRTHTSIGKVRPPFARLVATIERLDRDFIRQGIALCVDVDGLCESLNNIMKGLNLLSNVPLLKPILKTLLQALKTLDVEGTIQKTARAIKASLDKVCSQNFHDCLPSAHGLTRLPRFGSRSRRRSTRQRTAC